MPIYARMTTLTRRSSTASRTERAASLPGPEVARTASAYHPRTSADPDPPGRDHANPAAASSPPSMEAGKPGPHSADRLAYSNDEAARLTGLPRDLPYDQMHRGNLTYIKVSRRRLITRHHLQQFLGDAPT